MDATSLRRTIAAMITIAVRRTLRPRALSWLIAPLIALGCLTPVTASAQLDTDPGVAWSPSAVAGVQSTIAAAIAATPLVGTHLGVLAIDSQRGRVLYARNADDSFVPGSTLKLLTGILALRELGPNYSFTTQLVAHHGMLSLIGGGDPQLAQSDLQAAAAAVAARGITSIPGGLRIDERAYVGPSMAPSWTIDDEPFDYAAPITALSVDENTVHVGIRPSATLGAPGATYFHSAAVQAALMADLRFVNRTTTVSAGAKTTADAYWPIGAQSTDTGGPTPLPGIGVSGTIAQNAGDVTADIAVPNPAQFARRLLLRDLRRLGVTTASGVTAADGVLWAHSSQPLHALLADMWLPSDNFIAENLLRAPLHPSPLHPVSEDAAANFEIMQLAHMGIAPSTIMIVDGAGLSRQNALSPRALAKVLTQTWNSNIRSTVLNALPIAGVRGTIARRFSGTALAGRVYAKTGSVTNVSNLAGYVATKTHGSVTFVIFADDALIDDAPLIDLQRRILSALVNQ